MWKYKKTRLLMSCLKSNKMSDFNLVLLPDEVTASSQNNESLFLGLPSTNLANTVALNEGKAFRNKQRYSFLLNFYINDTE